MLPNGVLTNGKTVKEYEVSLPSHWLVEGEQLKQSSWKRALIYRHAGPSHGLGGLARLAGTGIRRDDAAGGNTSYLNVRGAIETLRRLGT